MKLDIVNPRVMPLYRVFPYPHHGNHCQWVPGDVVQVFKHPASRGLVVAVQDDENILILWSTPPYVRQVYNPCAEIELAQSLYDSGMVSSRTLFELMGLEES